jgi:hypothetical protein
MDINSSRGQKSLVYEREMLDIIKNKFGLRIIETDKDKGVRFDGLLCKGSIAVAMFESKCRNMSVPELEKYGSLIITNDKLEVCRKISKVFMVDLYVFCYCLKDKKVVAWKVATDGTYNYDICVKSTQTQKSINGGSAVRKNSFLPWSEAKVLN